MLYIHMYGAWLPRPIDSCIDISNACWQPPHVQLLTQLYYPHPFCSGNCTATMLRKPLNNLQELNSIPLLACSIMSAAH
jgi:hypothetical protein